MTGTAHALPETPPQGLRVLVVSEESLIGRGLSLALDDRTGIAASTCTRAGVDAALDAAMPDVVLLDVCRRPDGVGQVVDLLRRHPDAKVLVLAGPDEEDVVVDAVGEGACGYVTRAASVDEVATAVTDVASGHVVLPAYRLGRLIRGLSRPRAARGALPDALTSRERYVLCHVVSGRSTREVAADLGVTVNTARTHGQNVLNKLGVHTKLEAAAVAVQRDLVCGDPSRPCERCTRLAH